MSSFPARLRTMADVFAYAAAEDLTLRNVDAMRKGLRRLDELD